VRPNVLPKWCSLTQNSSLTSTNSFVALQELFIINVVLVALDIGLLVIENLSFDIFEIAFNGVSVQKLKIELAILGKLVSMSRTGSHVVLDHDLPRLAAQNKVPSITDEKAVCTHRERRRPSRADTD
jgi:hypothetical protein